MVLSKIVSYLLQNGCLRWSPGMGPMMEWGPGMIYAGFPSPLGFGVGGQSYSNFAASTVYPVAPW